MHQIIKKYLVIPIWSAIEATPWPSLPISSKDDIFPITLKNYKELSSKLDNVKVISDSV